MATPNPEMAMLDEARHPRDMGRSGLQLHPLKGDRRGQWSVRVSGNWRIVFRIEEAEVVDVDLADYHGGSADGQDAEPRAPG